MYICMLMFMVMFMYNDNNGTNNYNKKKIMNQQLLPIIIIIILIIIDVFCNGVLGHAPGPVRLALGHVRLGGLSSVTMGCLGAIHEWNGTFHWVFDAL